jgi:pimeloyl-ACP methyl ester carboxylesterase/DNA-binding CsgD family transcriptional regulator
VKAPSVQYLKTPDGFDIAYAVSGNGRLVVLMPQPINHIGIEWGSATYSAILEAMTRRFRLVRFDNRGSGMSSRGLPENFSMMDHVIDLECVLDVVGTQRAVLVGRITSGNVAVKYALAHPERVEALVLWNTHRDYKNSFARSQLDLSRTHWEYFLALTGSAYYPHEGASIAREMIRLSLEQADFAIRVQAAAHFSIAADSGKLRLPVLVLADRIPDMPNAVEAQRLAASIPDAQLRLLDRGETAMTPEGEEPAVVVAIADFLAALESAREVTAHAPRLSTRELEVLRLVAMGRSNQQIADELVISSNTGARHLSNVYDKTGVANRTEATAYASRNRLI